MVSCTSTGGVCTVGCTGACTTGSISSSGIPCNISSKSSNPSMIGSGFTGCCFTGCSTLAYGCLAGCSGLAYGCCCAIGCSGFTLGVCIVGCAYVFVCSTGFCFANFFVSFILTAEGITTGLERTASLFFDFSNT